MNVAKEMGGILVNNIDYFVKLIPDKKATLKILFVLAG